MELYTDKGNIQSLKILVSSNIANRSLTLKLVKAEDECHRKLPILATATNHQLFSANAAVRYIVGGGVETERSEALTDTWLEWEAVHLRTLIHRLVVATKSQDEKGLVVEMKSQLSCLESLLREHSQNGLSTVLEVVLWCSVFPLLSSSSPHRAALASDVPHLQAWFDGKLREAGYSLAVSQLMHPDVWTLVKTSFMAQPAPHSVDTCKHKMRDISLIEKASKSSDDRDSEIGAEAVTSDELARANEAWLNGAKHAPRPQTLVHPILPKAGKKNVLITSALPYVNNVPHLGNIIGCVLSADVFARFSRLCNHRTLYICGTDEYGTATETKAVEEGLTPQQICDKYHALHADIYSWFNISFDHFGRTTTQQQTECAQDIFWKLHGRGYISTDSVEQLQCVQCNRFLADRFVEGTCPFCSYEDARGDQCDKCGKLINAIELGSPRCKMCRSRPVVRSSEHLFLDLPKLEPLLVRHLDENFERGVWSSNTKVITRSWIRDGLHNRCITRDLKWGTPVPMEGFTDKVFYVWYDAPIGYVSITANYTDQWRQWWKNPDQVELYQFMAKDNVPFHSVIFPSCQLGTGEPYTIVNHLSATEYLNYEDGKFSKSRGVGVFGSDAKDTGIPADIWRFYLLFMRPENQDSAFSWDDFLLKNNSELLNNLGNFINRGLMFISNNFGGSVPEVTLSSEDQELLALVTREVKSYTANLQRTRLRDGIRNILSISRLGNQYMQSNAPWVLVKGSPTDKQRAGSVVGLAANLACLLSVLVQPYMPTISATIQQQLQAPPHVNVITQDVHCYLPAGHAIGTPQPLFQKIDPQRIQELKMKFAGTQSERKTDKTTTKEAPPSSDKPPVDEGLVQQLTSQVAAQGDKVRQAKSKKEAQSIIDEEVGKLLALKKELAAAMGEESTGSKGGRKKNKKKK